MLSTNQNNNTIFHHSLADEYAMDNFITKSEAQRIFDFLKGCKLFRWQGSNNDCEDRSNAVCLLLDAWNIPNYKGWVFSGYFLKKENSNLINNWNYHVAAIIPVEENGLKLYVIDPSTQAELVTLEEWASKVTQSSFSYHFIKSAEHYIFPSKKIQKDNWHKRDKRNHRWTMQGLSGINGVSSIGKAQLSFNKNRVKKTEEAFKRLKGLKP